MKRPDVSPEETDRKYRELREKAERRGYHINPDEDLAKNLVEGLVVNEKRYGFPSCPCRLAIGGREQNMDIICPCDYRDEDLVKYGACFCGLYVSWRVAEGMVEPRRVPDRRLSARGPVPEGVPIGAAVASVPDDLYEDSAASNPGPSQKTASANPGMQEDLDVASPFSSPLIGREVEPEFTGGSSDLSIAAAEIRRANPNTASLPYPVLRCRVCGYLCARDRAPEMCPICGAYSDRFERFL